MKPKRIYAVVAFVSTFTISALLFGSQSVKTETVSRQFVEVRRSNCPLKQTQQKSIRQFLNADQINGQEYYAEVSGIEGDSEIIDTALATTKLVRKMQKQSCSGLPSDFCAAWKLHLAAWQNQSNLQNNASATMDDSDETISNYLDGNEEINSTYEDLIDTARNYGVDFPE